MLDTISPPYQRNLLWILVISALSLAAVPGAVWADDDPDPTEISIEDLVYKRLKGMSLTNIHHTHDGGELMVGYQYMRMGMKGNLVGTTSVSLDQVHTQFGYQVSPVSMSMDMHMFHLMYGVTDWLSVMAMIPYKNYSMDLQMRMMVNDIPFTTTSSGVGDLSLSGLFSVFRNDTHRVVAELGFGFPTGSIDQKGTVPMGGGMKVVLGYPMQLGTGSYSVRPGLTYVAQEDRWLWGSHFDAKVQLNQNDRGYKVGEAYTASVWVAHLLLDWLSLSVRPEFLAWTNYDGADARLNPAMAPTNDPTLRGGERLDILFGVNVFGMDGWVDGHRLAFEGGVPMYQSLDGPQLETDYRFSLSWNWAF